MKLHLLFPLLAWMWAVPGHAGMKLSHFGDRLAFVDQRDLVPSGRIGGYQRFDAATTVTDASFVAGYPLLALPFAKNQFKTSPQKLFPVYRVENGVSQVIQIGFAIELLDHDIGGEFYDFMGVRNAYTIGPLARERLTRLYDIWRNKTQPGVRGIMNRNEIEWGRIPPYAVHNKSHGNFLAMNLNRFDLDQVRIQLVNDAVASLEEMLTEQGCGGELSVYDSAQSP